MKFYVSANTTITSSDYYLGQKSMSGIPANSWGNCDLINATVPSSTPGGSYYVGWIIDANSNVSESNEGNNKAYKTGYKLTVGSSLSADLSLQNLAVSRSSSSVRTFTGCSFSIKNNGPTSLSSEGVMIDYYLSDDTTFGDSDDRKIGDTGFTLSIASGATRSINLSSTGLGYMSDEWVLGLVPNGDYYVYAKVRITDGSPSDPTSGNNHDRTGSKISYTGEQSSKSDLYDRGESYRSFTSTSLSAGDNITVKCDVRNGGTVSSGSFVVKFYASANTTISSSDYYLGQKNMSGISANSC